jgi:arylsulfatase A-like enzyme
MPGRIPVGIVSQQVWTFADFLPTISELTGVKVPGNIDGVSVWQSWLNGKPQEHPPLYFEFHERGFNQAARIGDWKAVKMSPTTPLELYDLKSDLAEANNLASQYPAEVARFEAYLKSARTGSEMWPIRPAKAKNVPNATGEKAGGQPQTAPKKPTSKQDTPR